MLISILFWFLLTFTPNLTLTLDPSLTLVSSAILLWNTWPQVPTKLPSGFEHTALLILAYLAGYDTRISDFLSYFKAINRYNITQWKLGCDDKFYSLDENNT